MMTDDYKRNGTTTLFAAQLAQVKVVGECYQRHRHQDFLKFLRHLDEEFPEPVPCTKPGEWAPAAGSWICPRSSGTSCFDSVKQKLGYIPIDK